jgi:hypothetical protein
VIDLRSACLAELLMHWLDDEVVLVVGGSLYREGQRLCELRGILEKGGHNFLAPAMDN